MTRTPPSLSISAPIWTGDRTRPRASRIEIVDGRVRHLDESAVPTAGDLDLRDAFCLPAFVDAHLHLVMGGLGLGRLDLSNVASRPAFESAIAHAAAELDRRDPTRSRWLEAWGWSAERWRRDGHGDPDRSWLAAAGDRPAIAWRMDQHACLLNAAALAIVERTHPGLPDLPGGTVIRDADGRPSGVLVEANAWRQAIPQVPPPDAMVRREATRAAAQHLVRHGIAAVGAMEYASELRTAVLPELGTIPIRIAATLLDREWPLDVELAAAVRREIPAEVRDRLRVIGFKAFADGTFGLRTARMLEPYADRPDTRGMLVELALGGHLEAWATAVRRAGLSPSIHAIGDEAFRLSLDAVEAAERAIPDGTRPAARIEHGQTVHPADLARLRGRVVSVQPAHRADDALVAERALGEHRLDRFFPLRSMHEAGAVLAFGSDWPVVPPDPIAAIRSAVTARTVEGEVFRPGETLSVEATLVAATTDAAGSLGFEDAGVLAPGRRADVAVLDRDPFTADWLHDPPRVVATIAGGEIVFDRDGRFDGR